MQFVRTFSVLSLSVVFAAVAAGCSDSSMETGNASATAAVPVNEKCPIMGGKVSEDASTVEWNGMTIGFCCDGCDDKFLALSDEEKAEKLAL
ncbi:MAG: hypothetical protein KDA80_17040 [Planctomycetaceae bacterium]|nr:hypothetical protein [Planctomycetaceae bacterium]